MAKKYESEEIKYFICAEILQLKTDIKQKFKDYVNIANDAEYHRKMKEFNRAKLLKMALNTYDIENLSLEERTMYNELQTIEAERISFFTNLQDYPVKLSEKGGVLELKIIKKDCAEWLKKKLLLTYEENALPTLHTIAKWANEMDLLENLGKITS